MRQRIGALLVLLLLIAGFAQFHASAAGFLKIEGVDGEASDPDHNKWIEIFSFGVEVKQAVSHRTDPRGSRRTLDPSLSDIVVVKELDKSSPKLMEACAAGTHYPEVELHLTVPGGETSVTYLTITMTDVIVSSWSTSGDADDRPTEEVAFNYAKIVYTYKRYGQDGSLIEVVTEGWDVENGQPYTGKL